MKNRLFAILAISFLLINCQNKNETKDIPNDSSDSGIVAYQMNEGKLLAVDLNNFVSGIQKSSLDMVDSLFRADSVTVSQKLNDLLFEININIGRLNDLDSLPKSKRFVASVVQLLKYYKSEVETSFTEMIPLIYQTERTKSIEDSLLSYDVNFVRKEAKYFEKIVLSQQAFADANHIILAD